MGGCAGCGGKDQREENTRLARRVFARIDSKGEQKLTQQNLPGFFRDYPESSMQLLMKEMDFNCDGVITRQEWLAYWEYLRLAGSEEKMIRKALLNLEAGTVFLNFPKAVNYQKGVPRETLINDIIKKNKLDEELPFALED